MPEIRAAGILEGNPAAASAQGLLHGLLQQLRQSARERRGDSAAARGLVIAFTSANSGEGVTHTVETLLRELSRDPRSRTLRVDSRDLRTLDASGDRDAAAMRAEIISRCRQLESPVEGSLWVLAPATQLAGDAPVWDSSWDHRAQVFTQLRSLFDYVLLDCPALRTANDALTVAPFADGVMLIVEANRTRREQVLHAQRSIESARGQLLGHILNKRSYAVPDWLYRRL